MLAAGPGSQQISRRRNAPEYQTRQNLTISDAWAVAHSWYLAFSGPAIFLKPRFIARIAAAFS
jgi:hypothetical protein